MRKGKPVVINPNAPRCGHVSIVEWAPTTEPMTLSIPGKGLLRVTDASRFCLGVLMRLEARLTGEHEPEGQWNWPTENYVDALKVLGVKVELQFQGGAKN